MENIDGEMEVELERYKIKKDCICDRCQCLDYCVSLDPYLSNRSEQTYCMQCMEAITYDLIQGVKKIVRNNIEKDKANGYG